MTRILVVDGGPQAAEFGFGCDIGAIILVSTDGVTEAMDVNNDQL